MPSNPVAMENGTFVGEGERERERERYAPLEGEALRFFCVTMTMT